MPQARTRARLRLIQELYADSVNGGVKWGTDFKQENYDEEYYKKLKNWVRSNIDKIDELIREFSPKRKFEDINKVDLAILRVAIAEGFLAKMVPVKVAINEAVELAKRYGNKNSYRFVNGLLGNLLRNKFPELIENENNRTGA